MTAIGSLSLELDRVDAYEGRSLSNLDSSAIAHYYRVTRGRDLDLEVVWSTWVIGEQGVRLASVKRGPERLGRLLKGGRLGIYSGEAFGLPDGIDWCQLRVMRERDGNRLPTAVNMSYADTVRATGGEDVWNILSDLGALAIGPESHLLLGKTGSTPVITFPTGEPEIPVAAWALTRVLPIINRFKG